VTGENPASSFNCEGPAGLRSPRLEVTACADYNSAMPNFIHVAELNDIPPGTAKVVAVQNVEVALFNLEGSIYAIDNMCQHAGGPLGEGTIKGDTVVCPWHGYRYHIKTGQYVKNPDMSVACYPVKVENGRISVAVAP
jgi:3-phenylpropionate/trans-cinnamate dioxygenase ferredoxin component